MLIDQDVKKIGTIDLKLIDDFISQCFQINWDDSKFNRSEISLSEGRLCTLPYPIRNESQQTYSKDQEKLIDAAMPIVDHVSTFLPDLKKVRGEIVNLYPGKELKLHKDIYWFHKHSRRIHVPLTTNSRCFQIFENRFYNLLVGTIYEINNRIMHSACNYGTANRIHLILDFMSIEKAKEALSTPGLAMSVDDET